MTRRVREQGQRGAEGPHSSPEREVHRGDLSLSPSSPALAGTLPRVGEGPSLCPAVVHLPPLTAAAVQLHQSHPRLGGRRGVREERASWACWPGDFGFCL